MSELKKVFMEYVQTRDVEGVQMYVGIVPVDVLKKMRILANKKDYSEIVEIIDNEIKIRA